jgi:hypothetical protein
MSTPVMRRSIASLLLIIMIESILQPTVGYALTLGPSQPEYTSYESPGSTDMVNLTTGDFTFSLPLLEVPGPEGSFSMPLTYNGGIGLDQEASWVGLGWTMNAGAISRSINQFPDDANGEFNSVTVQDLVGLKGWEADIPGVARFGDDNQKGHYGQLSLLGIVNANWSKGYTSVGIAGFNATNKGFQFDKVQAAMAAFTVATMGTTAALDGSAVSIASSLKTQAIESQAFGSAMDIVASMTNLGTSSTTGYWKYDQKNLNLVVFKKFRQWLDKTRNEQMYGALFLGNASVQTYVNSDNAGGNASIRYRNGGSTLTLNQFKKSTDILNTGAASDINYETLPGQEDDDFYQVNNPALLAADNFSVKAGAVSGAIVPYRLDMGTVSKCRLYTIVLRRFSTYLKIRQHTRFHSDIKDNCPTHIFIM